MMNKYPLYLLLNFLFFTFCLCVSDSLVYAEGCPPPEVNVLEIDEVNGSVIIEVISGGNTVIVSAEDDNGVEVFSGSYSDGIFAISYFPNAIYSAESICPDGNLSESIIIPGVGIDVLAAIGDIMEIGSENDWYSITPNPCDETTNEYSRVNYVYLNGKVYSKTCWCECMSNKKEGENKSCSAELNSITISSPDNLPESSIEEKNYAIHNKETLNDLISYEYRDKVYRMSRKDCLKRENNQESSNKRNSSDENSSVNIFPNPFQNTFNLGLSIPENAFVNVQVYNILGIPIKSCTKEDFLLNGKHQWSFDTSNLEAGVYIFVVRINNENTILRGHKL